MVSKNLVVMGVTAVALATASSNVIAGNSQAGRIALNNESLRPGPELSLKERAQGLTDVSPEEFNLDDYAGWYYRGKEIFDLSGVLGQIDSGNSQKLNAGTITYTFLDSGGLIGLYNNPNYGFTAGDGLGYFSERQKQVARESIALWDDLISAVFVEKNGKGADIQFANSYDPGQAYAYYPEYSFTPAQGYKFFGDVFIADPEINWTNNWLGFNGYGATTLIHEIGHSVGLSHPGAYNGAGAIDYLTQAEYAQDSEQYSIMSYWSPSETGASILNWALLFYGNAQTPMLHDILAMHAKYGPDVMTRSGDTTYGFNSNAGRDVFDFSQNEYPNVSIYDAGGIDTIDLSGFEASVFINLNDGSFSSAAQEVATADEVNSNSVNLFYETGYFPGYVNQAIVDSVSGSFKSNNEIALYFDTGISGLYTTALYNLSIAYGTVIEIAMGGSARDFLLGNSADNELFGNAGDDVLDPSSGMDVMTGGEGADTFRLSVIETGDEIADFESGIDVIDVSVSGVTFSFIGNAAYSNAPGELRFDGGVLEGDVDGDGVSDLVVMVDGDDVAGSDLIL